MITRRSFLFGAAALGVSAALPAVAALDPVGRRGWTPAANYVYTGVFPVEIGRVEGIRFIYHPAILNEHWMARIES